MNKDNVFSRKSPPVTDADLDDVEALLGYGLPPSLRRSLLAHNGGRSTLNCFVSHDGSEFELNRFLAIKVRSSPREPTLEEVVETYIVQRGLLPERLVPFAEDAGGNLYCVDRITQHVVFCDHEHLVDPDFTPTDVADSLDYFLSHLISQTEMYDKS